jgi:RNA polymerase sigma-70 factor (ECF subfamily)
MIDGAKGFPVEDGRWQLDAFLASVEGRAYRMALMVTGNRADALDMVQDAMLGWVRYYRNKPEAQWKPLFYRVLNSRICDWHRRRRVRDRVRKWFGGRDADAAQTAGDPIEQLPDAPANQPADRLEVKAAAQALDAALQQLPLRQRQAFLLRAWEGLSVKETARAMACSQGSVKTHYTRALTSLRRALEGHWP